MNTTDKCIGNVNDRCPHCGGTTGTYWSRIELIDDVCKDCGRGLRQPTIKENLIDQSDTPRTDACPHCGCPLATSELKYMACFPCMSKNKSENKNPRTDSVWDTYWTSWERRAKAMQMMSKQLEQELSELWSRFDKQMEAEAEVERLQKQLATAHEELCQAGLRDYGN